MLAGVNIVCFAAGYAVALLLELSRLVVKSGVRGALLFAFAGLGFVAHTIYLVNEALAATGPPLSSWYHWYLLAAWVLAATYLYLLVGYSRTVIGPFLLPAILGLIAAGHFLADRTPFSARDASPVWAMIHGFSLLVGTVVVLLGFMAGVMYLVAANRLKQKRPLSDRFRLPSLEWLQRINSRSIVVSVLMLGVGVASGIILNVIPQIEATGFAVAWSDPVVWSSGVMFLWLVAVSIFGAVYRPARQGRKVAYLTLGSFLFLLLVLGVKLLAASGHSGGRGVRSSEFGVRSAELCCVIDPSPHSSLRTPHSALRTSFASLRTSEVRP